jgi:V8-like Glu-specific endopeptidase
MKNPYIFHILLFIPCLLSSGTSFGQSDSIDNARVQESISEVQFFNKENATIEEFKQLEKSNEETPASVSSNSGENVTSEARTEVVPGSGDGSINTTDPASFNPETPLSQMEIDASQALELIDNNKEEDLQKQKYRILFPNDQDGRIEKRQLDPSDPQQKQILDRTEAVFGLVGIEKLSQDKTNYLIDDKEVLGKKYGLCDDEPYAQQTVACFCSGFLIAPDLLVTARHCMDMYKLDEIRIISGFEVANKNGIIDLSIPATNVFRPVALVNDDKMLNLDLVLLRLDRPAENHFIPKLKLSETLEIGTPLYAVGHPVGLPLKISLNGSVIENNAAMHFYAKLNTYQGNSGSPVFNAMTHAVEGILIEGMEDFVSNGNCRISNHCVSINCKGEKILKIGYVINYLVDR